MRKPATKKFSSLMNKKVLQRLREHAKQHGHSIRYVLEQAVEHYLGTAAPSQETVRPEIIALTEKTIARNSELLKRLAKRK